MLAELAIRNLAIIRDLRLAFAPGLNALTGETGAGKSIIIDALSVALGARASADLVRAGASKAWVEAVFDVTALVTRPRFQSVLNELEIEPEEGLLVLTREISASGRSLARVNGRTVPLATVSALGRVLVDIHGQTDHLSLLRPETQLEILDRYAGAEELRSALAASIQQYRHIRRQLQEIVRAEREREQRIDALRFQLQEITAAQLSPGEEETLLQERARLLNAERLAGLAQEIYGLLEAGEGGTASALDALRLAASRLAELTRLDPSQAHLLSQLEEARYALEDLAQTIREYGEQLEADPDRLAAVEDRLQRIKLLKRKYGDTIPEILSYAERVARELQTLEHSTETIEHLQETLRALLATIREQADALTARRRAAAEQLEQQVAETLAALNLARARFVVALEPLAGESDHAGRLGIDEFGQERVEFLLAANAGQEPRPLARVASGGEMARILLALKTVLSEADATPTLVFDEVDVGVGGRSGQVVGEQLWRLAQHHQVLVISHLPQVAAFADQHFRIIKVDVDGITETQVLPLNQDERILELAAMLDGLPVTPQARANAEALYQRVQARKAELALTPVRQVT